MREQQWILIDNFKRKMFVKTEIKKIILKGVVKNSDITNSLRYFTFYKKNKLTRFSSITRQINRCFISGRPWYVLRISRMSRFQFRNESNFGNLPGFSRASW